MATTCPDCGQAFGLSRKPVETVTGRVVYLECRDEILAAAAGVVTSPTTPVAGAIATQGGFVASEPAATGASEASPT